MTIKQVDIHDFADELGAFTKRQLEQLKQDTVKGIAKSIPDLVAKSPVDTGLYAQSWDFSSDEMKAVVGNYAPHSSVIEDGARPFTPPIGPLLAWAKRVLQDPSQPETGYSSRVWALAKGTQKKITAQGMQPKHIMADAIPGIIENIKREYNGG